MSSNGTRGETEVHRELKRRAILWALAHDFPACGVEVRVPRSGFRADVAAIKTASSSPATIDAVVPGEAAIFECKQARADLLRDSADETRTLERLRTVFTRRVELERQLGVHLPNLRRGETLFPECDAYDFSTLRHDGLHAVHREEAQLQTRLFAGTKFDRLCRYRCADRLYLVVAPGVMAPHEAPAGWGVLQATGEDLELVRAPVRIECPAAARLALLQNIALAGTRTLLRDQKISRDDLLARRRRALPS